MGQSHFERPFLKSPFKKDTTNTGFQLTCEQTPTHNPAHSRAHRRTHARTRTRCRAHRDDNLAHQVCDSDKRSVHQHYISFPIISQRQGGPDTKLNTTHTTTSSNTHKTHTHTHTHKTHHNTHTHTHTQHITTHSKHASTSDTHSH